MKVTKIVREYITEQVNAKYQPKLDAIAKKYDGALEKLNEIKEQTVKEMSEVVNKTWRERLAPFYTEEDLNNMTNDRCYVSEPRFWGAETIETKKRNKESSKIIEERDNAIKNILITLELGGTKADLDRMLSEIKPEEE